MTSKPMACCKTMNEKLKKDEIRPGLSAWHWITLKGTFVSENKFIKGEGQETTPILMCPFCGNSLFEDENYIVGQEWFNNPTTWKKALQL